jgi:hypothetical protein
MEARSAPARAECAHRRAFKVHAHCFSTHRQGDDEDKTMVDALASYTGTVMRCPPVRASAPDVKERGQTRAKHLSHLGSNRLALMESSYDRGRAPAEALPCRRAHAHIPRATPTRAFVHPGPIATKRGGCPRRMRTAAPRRPAGSHRIGDIAPSISRCQPDCRNGDVLGRSAPHRPSRGLSRSFKEPRCLLAE